MYSPDEVRSIRAEMQRDAAPPADAPVPTETCSRCGEETDNPRSAANESYMPNCSAVQTPPTTHSTPVLCADCFEPTTKRDRVESLLAGDGIRCVVEYRCGSLKALEGESQFDAGHAPHPGWSPTVAVEHRCGSVVEKVWTQSDVEGGDA